MSHGVLIAEEQTILQAAEPTLAGTLSDIKVKSKASQITYKLIKRSFDILFGFLGCLFILPLAILIKLAYVLTGDFGSIFFVQKRIGLHGREFNFYKFRTMVKNADEALKDIIKNEPYKSEWQKYRKLKNDPRISKIGHILRRTSLDEFPQFLNVLKGNMSLIGNRPYLPREKDDISEEAFADLMKTKPGITGYWQVSGRSKLSFSERKELELEYSDRASLALDTAIFFKTFKSVLTREGAD